MISTGGTLSVLREAGVEARAGRGPHRIPGDPRRAGEDAPSASARGAAGRAGQPRARRDAEGARDRGDRPGLRQPLPLRAHGRPARRARGGGDREHRRRRADDDPRRREEPSLRRGGGPPGELRRGARRARGDRRALRRDPALARQRGLCLHGSLRRGDQPLVRPPLRAAADLLGDGVGEGDRPLLRREPAPAGGALRRAAGSLARPLAGGEAARQAALVQQRARPELRADAARRPRGAGLRDRQAQQPVRGRRGRRDRDARTRRPSPATRCPPSAG